MNKVDVDIYIAQLIKFFDENPTDLNQIIGDLDSKKFYEEVRIQAEKNLDQGSDVQLTQNQILNIVVRLTKERHEKNTKKPFFYSKFGSICLN